MKSIFASKLYKVSSRKDRIHAALMAPGNLSLVQQLADSLDEQYKTPENFGVEPKEEASEDTSAEGEDLFVDEEVDPEKDLVTVDDLASKMSGSAGSHHSAPSQGSAPSDSEGEKSETDTSELMPDSPMTEEKPKEEPAEASTKITSSTVADLNILKATLNSRADLAGVARIAQKENEVWIYYNDDVNLNNILTKVIECLMTKEYESFEFNRLARSDNAIVFTREIETLMYPDKTVEEAQEDQK